MYIDTHCHLSHEDYLSINEVIQENREAFVSPIIISGCTKETIVESLEIAHQYDDIYVTLGYHPSEVENIFANDLVLLEEQLKNTKVVGVGEIGLDYYYGKENRDLQLSLFEKQLQLAEKLNLPVVIHSRDAVTDTIELLKKYHVRGVIHCFSGSLEIAKIYTEMGFLLGIGGVLTFKNSNLAQVVEKIGMDHLVLETDSPYLTPMPFRGQKNSSKYIPLIASKLADIFEIDTTEIASRTTDNASNLFDFTSHL